MGFFDSVKSSATISECGQYRYTLIRTWDDSRPVLHLLMLNPSKAGPSINDPTIRRGISLGSENGFGSLVVENLFAYRSTDPKGLLTVSDPVGPDNNRVISKIGKSDFNKIVVGWGNVNKKLCWRIREVLPLLPAKVFCFGITKQGQPRHPLFIPSGTPIREWVKP